MVLENHDAAHEPEHGDEGRQAHRDHGENGNVVEVDGAALALERDVRGDKVLDRVCDGEDARDENPNVEAVGCVWREDRDEGVHHGYCEHRRGHEAYNDGRRGVRYEPGELAKTEESVDNRGVLTTDP